MKKEYINISKYEFHDGSIFDFFHKGFNIVISMESAELLPEEVEADGLQLSELNTLRGKLHIEGVKKITIDEAPYSQPLILKHETATILSFEITKGIVHLEIIWQIPFGSTDLEEINIFAENIWWKNLPELINPK